jgi:hypothetical protein
MVRIKLLLVFCVVFVFVISGCGGGVVPERTIIFEMDGLHVNGIERIGLTNLEKLKERGCYYTEVYLPLAAHPKDPKSYPHTCSVGNPVMMAGTVLIRPDDEMIQDSFGRKMTAFVVNSRSYVSISKGFDIYREIAQDPPSDDVPVVEAAKEIIEKENPVFMRVHLQGSGRGGYDGSTDENKDKAWYRNIWHPDSLYIARMKKADRLLGEFVDWLEETGRLEKTVMIITSDNGQADIGGHPPYEPGSSVVPTLIFGPGIKKRRTFDYAEIIDIVPTIAYLNNVPAPKRCQGRILLEAIEGSGRDTIPPERYMKRLDEALLEQHKMSGGAKKPDVTIETIARWHEQFDDMKSLVEYCEKVSADMKGGTR